MKTEYSSCSAVCVTQRAVYCMKGKALDNSLILPSVQTPQISDVQMGGQEVHSWHSPRARTWPAVSIDTTGNICTSRHLSVLLKTIALLLFISKAVIFR